MLKRKVISFLKEWKNRPNRKPLLIEGPRQVGKTFSVRTFAKVEYQSCFELNFLQFPSLKTIFSGDLSSEEILTGIRLNLTSQPFIPGKTLLFLDEIQACPEAVTSLKFLGEDSRFDVIASGSALGIVHAQTASWPVGQIDHLEMWSLDFEEYLWAMGIDTDLIDSLRAYAKGERPIPAAIHMKMSELLRQYLALGGMPMVVQAFVDDRDYVHADRIQRNIYQDYTADIAHYAEPEVRLKAQACWQSIPAQLSKENHKFQYSVVEHRGSAAKFGSAVEWLHAARMVQKIPNVSRIEYPLLSVCVPDHFRLYPTDIGLLLSTYDFSLKRTFLKGEETEGLAESIVFRTAKGGIFEALTADMLCKMGYFDRCFFFRNEAGNVEIEFLIEGGSGVIPLEIKSGNHKTRSLDRVLQDDRITVGYKFADQNAGISGKKITLPLYMLPFSMFTP